VSYEDEWSYGDDWGETWEEQQEEEKGDDVAVAYLINSLLSSSSSLVVESCDCPGLYHVGKSTILAMMVDSGAAISACPVDFMQDLAMKMSSRYVGRYFVAANGAKIPALFSRLFSFTVQDDRRREKDFSVRMECCDVKKPILSVSELAVAGHRVVLDDVYPFIELWKDTPYKVCLPLKISQGTYWLLVNPVDMSKSTSKIDEMIFKVLEDEVQSS